MNKSITKTLHVVPPEVVEKELGGASDGSLWAYASVEETDTAGDIVRSAGIDYSEQHRPQDGHHMPILAQHMRTLPDGTPPVIGRVEEFKRLKTPDGKHALAFRMSWATDAQTGEVTDLAKKYRQLVPAYINAFSIGASVDKGEPIKGGGFDYTKTSLREISVVTLAACPRATVIRALEDDLDVDVMIRAATEELLDKAARHADALEKMQADLISKFESIRESLNERLDGLESAIVAASASPPDARPQKGPLLRQFDAITSQLEGLKKLTKR